MPANANFEDDITSFDEDFAKKTRAGLVPLVKSLRRVEDTALTDPVTFDFVGEAFKGLATFVGSPEDLGATVRILLAARKGEQQASIGGGEPTDDDDPNTELDELRANLLKSDEYAEDLLDALTEIADALGIRIPSGRNLDLVDLKSNLLGKIEEKDAKITQQQTALTEAQNNATVPADMVKKSDIEPIANALFSAAGEIDPVVKKRIMGENEIVSFSMNKETAGKLSDQIAKLDGKVGITRSASA